MAKPLLQKPTNYLMGKLLHPNAQEKPSMSQEAAIMQSLTMSLSYLATVPEDMREEAFRSILTYCRLGMNPKFFTEEVERSFAKAIGALFQFDDERTGELLVAVQPPLPEATNQPTETNDQ